MVLIEILPAVYYLGVFLTAIDLELSLSLNAAVEIVAYAVVSGEI